MNSLTQYDELKTQINTLKEACDFLPDVSTDEGYQKSKRVALDSGKILTGVEKTRKALKSDALEFGRKVDAEAKTIREEIEAFQLPHKEAYKKLDDAKKDREKARKAELEARVEEIRILPEAMRDSSSEEINQAYLMVMDETCETFYEFTEQALKARNSVRSELSGMFARAAQAEEDAAELEVLRKEQAIKAQIARDKSIADEARQEAEAEKQAAIDREAAAVQEAIDSKKRELAAIEKAELDKLELEAKIVEQKAEQAKQVELAEVKAKQDAIDSAEAAKQSEIKRQEQEKAREQDETDKREANKRHVGLIRKAAKEAMIAGGIDEATAKKIILAISNGAIPHITINY